MKMIIPIQNKNGITFYFPTEKNATSKSTQTPPSTPCNSLNNILKNIIEEIISYHKQACTLV